MTGGSGRSIVQGAIFALGLLLLLGSIWLGLKEGADGFLDATTGFQRTAALAQIGYGILALVCLAGVVRRSPWLRGALVGWSAILTLTGAMAPMAWTGAALGSGLMAGGITLVVALLASRAIWTGVTLASSQASR